MTEHYVPKHFDIESFQDALLDWFEQNLRDLPWRRDKDPYKIWVSEIMLQQTQVDTVIPYFEKFIERFPTLESLAEADEEEVLKLWEGLGYYSRARNLHQAVREVKSEYGGKVPDTREEISRLKGVGPYTAGAILSIAYNRPEPAVDGNVMRVLSRLFHVRDDIQRPATRKKFEASIRQLIAVHNPSYFNQALMELGALVCSPKSPGCLLCPVNAFCQAHQDGVQEELPVKGKAKPPREVDMVAGVIMKGGQVLIHKRPDSGLLAGLWEFPNTERQKGEDWEETLSRFLYESFSIKAETAGHVMDVKHTFSHLRWNLRVFQCEIIEEEEASLPPSARWVDLSALDDYAFPVSHGKIVKRLQQDGD
ncbi:MAG: A/G-specific adenine glycosylase [Bacillaceae bacterium]|nr:A/G-specific adenine glycosylase [Bacillaceae bacterium]